MNSIHPLHIVERESSSTLLPTTLLLTFMAVGYSLFYIKNRLEALSNQKKDVDEEDVIEEEVYQSWSGAFADGQDSLLVTLVREKIHTKKKNTIWVDWDGTTDSSVITRNFYLGNTNPSFSWSFEKRESDTKAIAKDTMIDGWESVIQIHLSGFVKEEKTSDEMNAYLKELVEQEKIEWQKTLLTKQEVRTLFN
jgi:hypothetical protein